MNGGGAVLPCPFKTARTVDFDFSQWFARIVFSCYFLYPFDAMLEDLILPSYISSVISSILFQVFLGAVSTDATLAPTGAAPAPTGANLAANAAPAAPVTNAAALQKAPVSVATQRGHWEP